MSENDAKRYFKKINTTFSGLNKQDKFAQMFINLLESGNTTLYQKERRERRIFDDSWMTSVEEAIPVIDKLTRRPREYLKKTSVVVPVERAKKVDSDTIRHLAANTQFIKTVTKDGDVIPTHVLTSYSDADIGTYENRFIRSLVDNLFMFVEKRYDLIIKKMHTEYVNFLNVKSTLDWNDSMIDYDITLKINQKMSEDEVDKKNQTLLNRITELRTAMTNFKLSKFMIDMKEFPPVKPPIMQTNILLKNKDYKRCYDLWILIEQADRIGFDVEVFDRDVPFDPEYLGHIENAMMLLYSTVANNMIEEFQVVQNAPFEFRKTKRPKVQKTSANDIYIAPGHYQFENYQLSQFYLDQIRNANFSRLKTLTDAGITVHESVDIIFQQISAIADAVFEDYIQSTYKPDEVKDLEEKIKVQNQIVDTYRRIEEIKRNGLKNLTTNKAIALLNLRNSQDEVKQKRNAEKAEQKRLLAEAELAKDAKKKAEDAEMKRLQQKIEQAQKVLDDAKKKMREKERKRKKSESSKAKSASSKKSKTPKQTSPKRLKVQPTTTKSITPKSSVSKPSTSIPKITKKDVPSQEVAKSSAPKSLNSKPMVSEKSNVKAAPSITNTPKAVEEAKVEMKSVGRPKGSTKTIPGPTASIVKSPKGTTGEPIKKRSVGRPKGSTKTDSKSVASKSKSSSKESIAKRPVGRPKGSTKKASSKSSVTGQTKKRPVGRPKKITTEK